MEKYLNENSLPSLQKLSGILNQPLSFVDLETTGLLFYRGFAIIEAGFVHINHEKIVERSFFINPQVSIPYEATEVTGITNDMVKDAKTFDQYIKYFSSVLKEHIFCGFNSRMFDIKGIHKMLNIHGVPIPEKTPQIDFRNVFLEIKKHVTQQSSRSGTLVEAAKMFSVQLEGSAHRAGYDIALTALMAEKMLNDFGIEFFYKEFKKNADQGMKDFTEIFLNHMKEEKRKSVFD